MRIPQQLCRGASTTSLYLIYWFRTVVSGLFQVSGFSPKLNYQSMLSGKSFQIALMINVIFGRIIFHVFIIAFETKYLITTLRLQHIYLIQHIATYLSDTRLLLLL